MYVVPGKSRTSGILCVARVYAGPMPEGRNCGGRQEPAQRYEAKNVPLEISPPTQGDKPSFHLGPMRNQRLSVDVEASMPTVEMGHRLKGEVPGMKVSVLTKGNRRFHTQDSSPPADHTRIRDFLTRAHS